MHQGYTCKVGDEFRVRVGELKQGGAGGFVGRGAVVEIEWTGNGNNEGAQGEDDWEGGEEILDAFWDGMGIKGARKVCNVAGLKEGEGCIGQWCEILRTRT